MAEDHRPSWARLGIGEPAEWHPGQDPQRALGQASGLSQMRVGPAGDKLVPREISLPNPRKRCQIRQRLAVLARAGKNLLARQSIAAERTAGPVISRAIYRREMNARASAITTHETFRGRSVQRTPRLYRCPMLARKGCSSQVLAMADMDLVTDLGEDPSRLGNLLAPSRSNGPACRERQGLMYV